MCGFIGIVFIMLLLFGNVIIKTIDVILLHTVMQLVLSVTTLVVLAITYILFMKKCYHLHEEYLASLKK